MKILLTIIKISFIFFYIGSSWGGDAAVISYIEKHEEIDQGLFLTDAGCDFFPNISNKSLIKDLTEVGRIHIFSFSRGNILVLSESGCYGGSGYTAFHYFWNGGGGYVFIGKVEGEVESISESNNGYEFNMSGDESFLFTPESSQPRHP